MLSVDTAKIELRPPLTHRCKGVTFSGPDLDTNISQLIELQCRYPFMEVGVLWNPQKAGESRYATQEWIQEAGLRGLNYSIHLCGKVARDLFEKGVVPEVPGLWNMRGPAFSGPNRIQINCNGMTGGRGWFHSLDHIQWASDKHLEFIIQVCDHVGAYWLGAASHLRYDVVPLFDKSGGKGLVIMDCPKPLPTKWCGYAGGINAENVATIALQIQSSCIDGNSFWLDMETGVRRETGCSSKFDLDLVAQILEIVNPLMVRF